MGGDSDVNFHLLFILVDGAVMAVVRPDWAHVMCTSVDSTAITAMAWGSILAHMLASPRQCGGGEVFDHVAKLCMWCQTVTQSVDNRLRLCTLARKRAQQRLLTLAKSFTAGS